MLQWEGSQILKNTLASCNSMQMSTKLVGVKFAKGEIGSCLRAKRPNQGQKLRDCGNGKNYRLVAHPVRRARKSFWDLQSSLPPIRRIKNHFYCD